MTPEELKKELDDLKREFDNLKREFDSLKNSFSIPSEIDRAFRFRFKIVDKLAEAPQSAITAPTGGVTQDANARTAINSIITALENLGLLVEN